MVVANEEKTNVEPSYEVIGVTQDGINIIRKHTGFNFGIPTFIQYPEYIRATIIDRPDGEDG